MGKVAVIGTEAMGTSITIRLIEMGFETVVYDVQAEALHPLLAMGAKRANQIADCTGSDVIIIVVAHDKQVEEVVAGPEGILNNLSGEIHPVMLIVSTVLPETVRRLGELCRAKGVELIDAPVSGGHVAAKTGDLSIMIGGPKNTFEKVEPVLSAIGRRLYHVGGLGAGETVKLINNMIGVANIWLTIEALATAVRNGLSLDVLLPIMNVSSGSNYYIRNWGTAKAFLSDVAKDLNSARSNLSLSTKDLEHAQEQAELVGCASPLLAGFINGLKELTPQYVVDQWSKILDDNSKSGGLSFPP